MKVLLLLVFRAVVAMAARPSLDMEGQITADDTRDVEVQAALVTAVDEMPLSYAYASSGATSFEIATGTAESGFWANESMRERCSEWGHYWQWLGTAPFCGGSEQMCTNRGMKFARMGQHGSHCYTGLKVLCYREATRTADDCNIFCNPGHFRYTMYGAGHFCGGKSCDCWRQGSIPIERAQQYQCPCSNRSRCPWGITNGADNSWCLTGYKQMCAKPIFSTKMNMEMLKSCDEQDAQVHETHQQALQIIKSVATEGVKALA